MATFINDQHIAHLSTNPSYYEYVTLTGEVSRSGNIVTLSNLSVSVRVAAAYSVYGENQTYYIADSSSSTTQLSTTGNFVFNFSDGPNHTESHSMGDMSISVGTSDTSKTLYLRAVGNEDSPIAFTITFPAGGSAPSVPTLTVSNVGARQATFTYQATDWGSDNSGTVKLQRYVSSLTGWKDMETQTDLQSHQYTTSSTFFRPNNQNYPWRVKATNTIGSTYSSEVRVITLPALDSISVDGTNIDGVTIAYSTLAGGGYYAQNIEYSLDNGTTWTTGATIPSGITTAQSGTFTISNLTPGSTYTILTRISTTAGSTSGTTLTVTIPAQLKNKLYGSANSLTTLITEFYGPVSNQAQKATRIYGSVNGQAKLVYQGFGHIGYGAVVYWTDDNHTTTAILNLSSQSSVNNLWWTSATIAKTIEGVSLKGPNVKEVYLTWKTASIPDYFLGFCTSLEKLDIQFAKPTSIGDYFLYNCSNFNSAFVIPDAVTSIGSDFLYGCSSFNQDLTLPSSLTHLGANDPYNGPQFMRDCSSMTSTVNVGALNTSIISATDLYSFSTSNSSDPVYVTGVKIAGTNRSAWLSYFPNRTSSPYRNLIDAGH